MRLWRFDYRPSAGALPLRDPWGPIGRGGLIEDLPAVFVGRGRRPGSVDHVLDLGVEDAREQEPEDRYDRHADADRREDYEVVPYVVREVAYAALRKKLRFYECRMYLKTYEILDHY